MRYKVMGVLLALELLVLHLKRKNKPPSIRGVVETVHSLPDRMRLRVPSLVDDPDGAALLQKSLASVEAITSARVNPVSGSVVIRFDPNALEPVVLFGAVVRILGLDETAARREPSRLWREIDAAGKAMDDTVRHYSADLMDIKTVITLSLVGALAYRALSGRNRLMLPGNATLAWWVFNLMLMRGLK